MHTLPRDLQNPNPAETLTPYATILHGTVTAFSSNKGFIVGFSRETCTCGHFQERGVQHAVACLHPLQVPPRDTMPYSFNVAAMKAMYTGNYRGIDPPCPAFPPGTAEITKWVPSLALPMQNPRHRPKDRPATARKEWAVRSPRHPNFPENAPQCCSKFNLAGHN